jgi:hypothetical protein
MTILASREAIDFKGQRAEVLTTDESMRDVLRLTIKKLTSKSEKSEKSGEEGELRGEAAARERERASE